MVTGMKTKVMQKKGVDGLLLPTRQEIDARAQVERTLWIDLFSNQKGVEIGLSIFEIGDKSTMSVSLFSSAPTIGQGLAVLGHTLGDDDFADLARGDAFETEIASLLATQPARITVTWDQGKDRFCANIVESDTGHARVTHDVGETVLESLIALALSCKALAVRSKHRVR